MSKFYEIKDLLSLKKYSEKYKVGLRKIYRYIGDELIEHYMIDGVAFLPDKKIPILKESHTKNQLNSVKNLTLKKVSVKTLTEYNVNMEGVVIKPTVTQQVNPVKIKTESMDDSVKILSVTNEELKLMVTPEEKLSAGDMERRINLLKKYDCY